MKKKTLFYLLVSLLVIWMIVIFCFSAQPATKSANLSEGVGRRVASILVLNFQNWDDTKQNQYVESIDFFVRKTAHFTEYMILGGLWLLCIYNRPDESSSFGKKIGISVCASAIYAISDEFHQLFVEGRAGRWMDVGIDTMGAIAGIGLVTIGIKLFILIRVHMEKMSK